MCSLITDTHTHTYSVHLSHALFSLPPSPTLSPNPECIWKLLMFLLGELNHIFNQSDLGEMAWGGIMSGEMFVLTRS